MEIADIVFRVGVGIGVVLVGIGVVIAALSLRPLASDVRSLARDAKRLTSLLDEEMPDLLDHVRSATVDAAAVSQDYTFRVGEAEPVSGVAAGLPAIGSVQSPDEDEDGRIA